jgi:hypothetical protein
MTAIETIEERNFTYARTGNGPRVIAGMSVLLALFVTLSLGAALRKSPTADENFHLVAGYSYLKWGDYRINPEHPPLVKLLAALPLLGLEINDRPLTRERRDAVQANGKYGWLLANQWLFSGNDAEKLFFYARLPMVTLGAVLGLLVFCWARELYGLSAAFAALALYVLDPNVLAHSPIIHTDIPFALAYFGGSYFFWRTLKEITWLNWLMMGVFFSMSAVTKFSFLTIPPIWGFLGLVRVFSAEPFRLRIATIKNFTRYRSKARWLAIILFSSFVLAYLTVWAAYGFHYEAVNEQRGALGVSSFVQLSTWLKPLIRFGAAYQLLPEAWLSGIVYALSATNRTAYLLGEISDGFWFYFPIAFAVKTPVPTLVLLVTSLLMYLYRSRRGFDEKFLLIPILLFSLFAVYARMNIGLRHILAIYPFLFVWLGGNIATLWASQSAVKKCGVLVLGIWLAASTLKSYPDFLAYFNETVEPRAAHEILVDSNLDWGQDLKGLKLWMDRNGVDKIPLAYFGTADPAYYGVNAVHRLGTWSTVLSNHGNDDETLVAPYIAISATHLVGVYLGPSNPYAKFLLQEPVVIIGGSILIYRTDQ